MNNCIYSEPGKDGTINHTEPSGKFFVTSPVESGQGLPVRFEACRNHLQAIEKQTKKLMLGDTPDVRYAQLEAKLVWHEMQGAVRYFVLAKCSDLHRQGQTWSFLYDEHKRLKDALDVVEKEATRLGAVWDDHSIHPSYKAPAGATQDMQNAIMGVRTDRGLLRFGVRAIELRQREKIMSILAGAIWGESSA